MVVRVPVLLWTIILVATSFISTGQEAGDGKVIAIELNKASNNQAGCRLTFVVRNDTQSPLEKASYEIAAFDASKTVVKLLVLQFGRLPVGKTKVVEFELAGVTAPTSLASRSIPRPNALRTELHRQSASTVCGRLR